ncbi:MAG: MGMT family protein [Patescibacteria group bacterium]|nr:MGMT family protein [Patescibacteria group bacterium]
MAIIGSGEELMRLAFRNSAEEAEKALGERWLERSTAANWNEPLQYRLSEYAGSRYIELDDVPVAFEGVSRFAEKVYAEVRKVRYGRASTYGEVAAAVGSPGAARAVGTVLAVNPIPIVVPCHRIIRQHGKIGNYSGPGGAETKGRLLQMECLMVPPVSLTKEEFLAQLKKK